MSEERDELFESLREDWRELEPPAADAALERPDARTEASVDWMRAAWANLEAQGLEGQGLEAQEPASPVLRSAARRAARVAARLATPLAAAASIAALWFLWPASTDPIEYERVASPEPPPMAAALHPELRADGSLELRSGKVRLILVTRPPEPPSSPPTDRDRPAAKDLKPSTENRSR